MDTRIVVYRVLVAVFVVCSSAASGAQSAPTITSLSVNSGVVGTSVTISGNNFGATQGSSTVTFNGAAASSSSWSNTQIAVTVPSSATSGNMS